MLEPQPGPRHPELISDGSGLEFAPAALAPAPVPLDRSDPAIAALLAYITARTAPKRSSRAPWKRAQTASPQAPVTLDGWRVLARGEKEVLFGHGGPAHLLSVTMRQEGLRQHWSCASSGATQWALRASRDGIRASSWRPDPSWQPDPADTELRLLVTEQAFASGQRADGRLLAPDIYADEHELVLRLFVSPRPGYQTGARSPETPVRVLLDEPLGSRQLIDGALAEFAHLGGPARPPAAASSDEGASATLPAADLQG